MYQDDVTRLRHMRDAAKEALAFVEESERSDLDTNRQLVLALSKSIEIVGEAASRMFSSPLASHQQRAVRATHEQAVLH